MASNEYASIRSALIGTKSDGSQYVLSDDEGKPISPSWNADGTALVGQDGTEYETIKYPVRVVYASQVPWAIAQSGTIGSNGALTLNTAMPTIFASGIWMYFPANAVYSGSPAGWYWTVLSSSTTVGTVYANYSTDITEIAYPPATPTSLSGTTGSAYTGWTGNSSTFIDVVKIVFGIPLEYGDSVTVDLSWWHSGTDASTNGKWLRGYGTNISSYIIARVITSGTGTGTWLTKTIQVASNGYTVRPEGWGTSDPNMANMQGDFINISNPSLTFAMSRQTATDYMVLAYLRIVHYSGTSNT